MNLWKRLAQIAAVTGAAGWMYINAVPGEAIKINVSPKLHQTNPLVLEEPEASVEAESVPETEGETASGDTEGSSQAPTSEWTFGSDWTGGSSQQAVFNWTEDSEREAASGDTELTDEDTESLTESEVLTETSGSESETVVYQVETELPGGEYEIVLPNGDLIVSYSLVPSFEPLRKTLNSMLDSYEGTWSVYVKDLKSRTSLTINNQPQDSASLIKLYIAGTILEEIKNGSLEETETIDRLLSDMICYSDNEAANELVRCLSDSHNHQEGLEKVNSFLAAHGFTDTHQYNGLEDSSLWYGDEVNITSAVDCGRFLEEVYNGTLVSHLASRQIEGYLLNQDITWKIPAGIPSEIKTANKTGEKDNTQNDVSIVYTPDRDYILCVLATNLTDEDTAVSNIRKVSSAVYDFFTESAEEESEEETAYWDLSE